MKVGKHIAPYLKQMMAVWVLCLHDPYPLPSSAANSAFRSAFVPSKQPEALSYCKEEIFNVKFKFTLSSRNDSFFFFSMLKTLY